MLDKKPDTKKCSFCRLDKPLDSFRKRSDRKSGYQSQCKSCVKVNYKPSREKAREYDKAWIARNPEKRREIKRAWWNKNSDYLNHNRRIKRLENPGNLKELETLAKQRRRAKKLENGHEPYSIKQVFLTHGADCHICLKPIDMNAPRKAGMPGWELGLQLDHVIPLSKGGPDTLENVKPSHGLCNLQKQNMVQ